VESHSIDKLFKKLCIPKGLRWKWVKASSRDNARTPMQWTAEPGAGFTEGKPWLGINGNSAKINYREQQSRADSVLSYYKEMIALRASSETLKYGGFEPLYTKRGVIAYARTLGDEKYVTILNFSKKWAFANPIKIFGEEGRSLVSLDETDKPSPRFAVAASNVGRKDFDGMMEPWEAIVVTQR